MGCALFVFAPSGNTKVAYSQAFRLYTPSLLGFPPFCMFSVVLFFFLTVPHSDWRLAESSVLFLLVSGYSVFRDALKTRLCSSTVIAGPPPTVVSPFPLFSFVVSHVSVHGTSFLFTLGLSCLRVPLLMALYGTSPVQCAILCIFFKSPLHPPAVGPLAVQNYMVYVAALPALLTISTLVVALVFWTPLLVLQLVTYVALPDYGPTSILGSGKFVSSCPVLSFEAHTCSLLFMCKVLACEELSFVVDFSIAVEEFWTRPHFATLVPIVFSAPFERPLFPLKI